MQTLTKLLLALTAVELVGCERSAIVQPDRHERELVASHAAAGGKPEVDPTYANGKTVYMIGPHLVQNARETMPNAYEHAEEVYLIVYPQSTTPTTASGPITLPSGYQPQCNPCFHTALPPDFVYHDHVIPGAPGMGTNGTSDGYMAPWKIILLVYNPAYAMAKGFMPIKSEADLDAAEEAGNVFLPINQGGGNPYEIDTGNLLICPTVSPHA